MIKLSLAKSRSVFMSNTKFCFEIVENARDRGWGWAGGGVGRGGERCG